MIGHSAKAKIGMLLCLNTNCELFEHYNIFLDRRRRAAYNSDTLSCDILSLTERRIILPTSTFYNLPQEKQKMILAAARKEFARVTFNEASINKIIQDAKIPRGSFYMYFKDKKDLLYCLLAEYVAQTSERAEKILRESNSDIFAVFIDVYDFTTAYSARAKQEMAILKNLFADIHSSGTRPDEYLNLQELFSLKRKISGMEEAQKILGLENSNIKNVNDWEDLMSILFSITKNSIAKTLFHMQESATPPDCSTQKNGCTAIHKLHGSPPTRERFINMINLVKYGAIKGDPSKITEEQ